MSLGYFALMGVLLLGMVGLLIYLRTRQQDE